MYIQFTSCAYGVVGQTDGKHWEKKQEYSIAKKRILKLSSFRINFFWASTSKAPLQLCHWTTSQKYVGIIFNYWLTFDDHSYSVLRKTLKNVGFPRKLQNTLPRPVLTTVYKTFLRALSISWYTHHNQAYKTSNTKKNTLQRLFSLEGTYLGTSYEKLFQESQSLLKINVVYCVINYAPF